VTKRHYLQSAGIFILSTFYVRSVLELHWVEAIGLVILAIVCVVHSIDVMSDIEKRKVKKHDDGESSGPQQGPQDPRLLE
jgi:uncharacterized membrane protein